MELTNGEIFNAKEPLAKLMQEKFPVKVSYGLAKLAAKLNEQLLIIEKVRQGLIETYGEKDPDNPTQTRVAPTIEEKDEAGVITSKPNPKFPKFAEELGELMTQKVEVVIEVVTLPEKVSTTCDKCNHNMDKALEIEPAILMALDKFIEVE